MIRRGPVIPRLVRLLALLVDGGGEVLGEPRVRSVCWRRGCEYLPVGLLCVRVLCETEGRVCDHQPRIAAHARGRIRELLDEVPAGVAREHRVLHLVCVLCRRGQHDRRLLVLREAVRKLD